MKKQLTDADYALLASRGINNLTTSTDFELPASWSTPKKVKKVKNVNTNANHPLVGRMLHTSWGYDMTINNFAKIIEVSPTGKTAVCRMLPKEGFNGFQGSVKAGKNLNGPKFRVKIKNYNNSEPYFNGSYPFIINGNTKDECSYKMGYWGLYNGEDVYENHMD